MAAQYYLQPPREQIFYKVLVVLANLTALGNKSWWGYTVPNIYYRLNNLIIIIFAPSLLISQLIYLYVNFNDLSFDTLGIIFSIIPVTCLANVNVYSAKFSYYKTLMKDFMCKIHLNNGKTESAFTKKKILIIERLSRWTAYYLIFFFSMNWVTWIWIPVFNNINNMEAIQNRTMKLQTCLYLWVPFDYSYNYQNWVIVHIINTYVVGMGVTVMMIFHTLNYIFMYHLIGHIQILKHKIRCQFPKNITNAEVKDVLIEVMKYHAFIIRVFKDVQSAFGVNVATNYLHNLVGDSLMMYQIMYASKENILLYVVMVTVYMGGLILMSFVLEEIRRQTEDLADVVYSMRWETMSISNQKIFLLFLQRVQPAMEFTALGGLKAGVKPMISIIKTTFSYYVMLETTMAEKS
ncbi:unnamed protein product [Pieris macdunnoughi]|uniref:Odorant receptor n=1 Tax=Pieris macdunnoughi TaxID=345717 RepID=A0A821R9T7_9NEOP|nr:unnamed protein product [Pieris macdunnoughi]